MANLISPSGTYDESIYEDNTYNLIPWEWTFDYDIDTDVQSFTIDLSRDVEPRSASEWVDSIQLSPTQFKNGSWPYGGPRLTNLDSSSTYYWDVMYNVDGEEFWENAKSFTFPEKEVEEVEDTDEDSEDIGIGGGGIAAVEQPIKPVPGPWAPFSTQVAVHIRKQKKAFAPPPPPQARKQFAEKVVSEYDKVIGNTTDLFYHNGVMRTNSGLFKIMLKVGLDILSLIKYYDEEKYEAQLTAIGQSYIDFLIDKLIPYKAQVKVKATAGLVASEVAETSLKVVDPLMNIFSEGLELIVKLIAPLISKEEQRENWLAIVDNLEAKELEAEEAIRAEIEEQQQTQQTIQEQRDALLANEELIKAETEKFKRDLEAKREQLKEDTKQVPEIIIIKNLAAVGDLLATVAFKIMANGLVLNWTGATMKTFVPPPGATNVVANLVLVPFVDKGKLIKGMKAATKQETEEDMIKQYVKLFKGHTKTLSGITIGMVPLVGVPTPIPFPWIGLKCGI